MNDNIYDVVVVGGGPIGIYTAYQATTKKMKTILIESSNKFGGQLMNLYPEKYIYDFPGYKKIQAQTLIQNLVDKLKAAKCRFFLSTNIVNVTNKNDVLHIKLSNFKNIKAKQIILCTGIGKFDFNRLEIPIDNVNNIHYNVENKESFASKEIIVLGGGDSAVD
jgi:thioredoxin reductase (NADPH)